VTHRASTGGVVPAAVRGLAAFFRLLKIRATIVFAVTSPRRWGEANGAKSREAQNEVRFIGILSNLR